MQALRAAFLELVAVPLTRLLAAPRVRSPRPPAPTEPVLTEPMLIVANHVTAYDLPLLLCALPAPLRRRVATAMSGEMLDDFRHARNPRLRNASPHSPQDPSGRKPFFPWGPPAYWLVTALFNVFPLPRLRDFQASFDHAGRALDRGYNVLVFPEGMRTAGRMTHFRPGIGILVKQSHAAVLPIGIRGLGELRASRRWFRSGKLEIHIGEPIHFSPRSTEAEITERLRGEVARLAGE